MANNVAASMTASIVIDKKELISNALAAYASAQKELDGNKIELLIDVSSDEARNKLKEIQKELSGKEYIIKFKNQGIEETIKSLDELANKIKDIISGKSTGNGKGNSFINEENLKVALDLFAKMESHLDSMRKVFADVGDGEEFSPLLKMINDVQKAVSNLGETVGKIKLNVNIESKGTDEQLLAKIEQRKQVLLNAYRDQFNAMRKVKPSGADVINSFGLASKSGSTVAALNKSINMFDESSLDSLDQKISAYEDMIKKLKRLSELSYGTNIYDGMDKSFGNKVSAAKGSLTKAINSLDSNSPDGLEGLFGKTDLSGVITQLETIADKLDKISKSASEFATSFKEGFNVNASIEELNKLTDRVKELEEELAKLKVSPVVSDRTPATSSPMKDVFQGDDKATTDASTTAIKEESQALEQVATSAKDAATSKEKFANANKEVKASAESSSTSLDEEKKKIENVGDSAEETKKKLDDVVFKPNTEGFDEIVSKLDIAKDKIEEISKITKSSVWSESQGEYLESYNIKYKNGTSEIRGESSNKKGSNVLRANEVAYDAKVAEQEAKALLEVERQLTKETEQQASAQQKKWKSFQQEQANYEKTANEVNNAISKTDELLNKLQLHEKLDSQFLGLLDSVDELNSKLKAGEISVSDYNKSVKSLTSEYSKLIDIQQKRDVETYEANAKAAEQEAKANQKLADSMAQGREQSEILRKQEEKRQQIAQDNAINKALENEYQQRQKNIQAVEKQKELDREKALNFTKTSKAKLLDAVSKYSYGDTSDAQSMITRMNRGVSNFGDLSNVDGIISNLSSIIDRIISDLKTSHDESLKGLNAEIKAETDLQNQKDAFHKKNLNAIDLEIQKREEESKMVSSALKTQMEERQKQLSSMESSLKSYQDKAFDLSIKPDEANRFPEYQAQLDSINKAIKDYENHINSLQNKGVIDPSDIDEANRLKSIIEGLLKNTKKFSSGDKGFTNIGADKVLEKIHSILEQNSRMSKTAKDQIKAYYNEIYSGNPTRPLNEILDDVYKIVQAEREAGRAGKSWLDIFKDKKIHSFLGQAASMFSFYDLINAGRQGINVIKDLDSAYTEMRKVSDETAQSLKNFQSDSFDVAKQVGVTALEIQNSAADFMRLGYSLKEASKLSEDANIYANVGDMDIGEATEHMISSIQAWQSEFSSATEASTNIINRYNEVGNRFAITSADIGSAMERSAAALKAGGNDLNEAIGIITAGNLIQQDADATANAIKVLSLRLRGAKADLESMNEETDGLVESTSKMREQIQALTGVDIMIDDSTFKSTAKIIQEIGAEWSNLSDVSQAATLELLAGKTRASTVAGLIENYQTIGEVIEAAEESENSARIENEKYLDSMEGRLNLMTSQLQEMASVSLNDNLLKEGISALTKILELTTNIVDTFGALPTVFTTGGIGAFIANFTWPSMATNNYNLSYSF